ncbi:hypothetical protein A28LD_0970 [Idiomarina sp. A28L]|uniref:hypothetical protein n=1 Tax=Idiomarina sp. A28L TaxID=1036674 RepID=UPI0002138B22|nr:hypothetical protein [Idiomarina sp. A28L]EGN75357.1 hypothetical protein A28LD_0970 [Idiomarina sp. A28L]
MKKILGILGILFLTVNFNSLANVNNNTEYMSDHLIVCNSVQDTLSCDSVTTTYLEQETRFKFGDDEPEVCTFNCPIAPVAPEPGSGGPTLSVDYIIVDAANGSVTRVKVERFANFGQSSFHATHVTPTSNDIAFGVLTYELEVKYLALLETLTFTQASEGAAFLNSSGQTLSDLGFTNPGATSADVNSVASCPTAYSWVSNDRPDPTLPSCRAFIQGQLDRMGAEAYDGRGFGAEFYDTLSDWGVELDLGFISAKVPEHGTFRMIFNNDDGSRLVLDIQIDGALLTADINMLHSRAASGESLATFDEDMTSGSGSQDISYHEANSIFGAFDCGPQLRTLGVHQTFRVEFLEFDDQGRPSRVRFVLLDQYDVNIEEIVCTNT